MDLLKIQLNASALDNLGSAGIKTKKRLQNIVEDLSITAVRAFESKIPIDTGELRNTKIDIDIQGKGQNTSARIYIGDSIHYGKKGHSIKSSLLAQHLQDLAYKRSKDSQANPSFSSISKGSPTTGWVDSGRTAFYNVYRTYLRNLSG